MAVVSVAVLLVMSPSVTPAGAAIEAEYCKLPTKVWSTWMRTTAVAEAPGGSVTVVLRFPTPWTAPQEAGSLGLTGVATQVQSVLPADGVAMPVSGAAVAVNGPLL